MTLKPMALAISLLPFTLTANTQLGVHEHGFGQLNLAQNGNQLVLELFSPAADIVGFEHNPATHEEQSAYAHALEKTLDGAALFHLTPAAGCTLTGAAHANGDEHHDDEHHQDEHADHHDDDDHDHHDDKHGHHHDDKHDHEPHGEYGHKDISVRYHYQCSEPEALNGIEVTLFEQFPSFTRIELQGILPTGQIAATLTPDQPRTGW